MVDRKEPSMTRQLRAKKNQNDHRRKGKPTNKQEMIELTEQDLEQVQGGLESGGNDLKISLDLAKKSS
jgi:bacteriocin-like protein